jgi:hypothetical protein
MGPRRTSTAFAALTLNLTSITEPARTTDETIDASKPAYH